MYTSHFPRVMLYCSVIKVDLAATRFSSRISSWDELTDERLFSPNYLIIPFVILYTKPMLQITRYIIQTTYLSRITNPTMFIPDHITRIKFIFISLDLSDSSVWPWSSSWDWACSSSLESVFSIAVRSSYSSFLA